MFTQFVRVVIVYAELDWWFRCWYWTISVVPCASFFIYVFAMLFGNRDDIPAAINNRSWPCRRKVSFSWCIRSASFENGSNSAGHALPSFSLRVISGPKDKGHCGKGTGCGFGTNLAHQRGSHPRRHITCHPRNELWRQDHRAAVHFGPFVAARKNPPKRSTAHVLSRSFPWPSAGSREQSRARNRKERQVKEKTNRNVQKCPKELGILSPSCPADLLIPSLISLSLSLFPCLKGYRAI